MKSGLYQILVDDGLLIPHEEVNAEPYDKEFEGETVFLARDASAIG